MKTILGGAICVLLRLEMAICVLWRLREPLVLCGDRGSLVFMGVSVDNTKAREVVTSIVVCIDLYSCM